MESTQGEGGNLYVKKQTVAFAGITVEAVCVYPTRVTDAVNALKAAGFNIPVASVAAEFPSGQTPLETKLAEIKLAVEYGAREIDTVISRSLVLTGQWEGTASEIAGIWRLGDQVVLNKTE